MAYVQSSSTFCCIVTLKRAVYYVDRVVASTTCIKEVNCHPSTNYVCMHACTYVHVCTLSYYSYYILKTESIFDLQSSTLNNSKLKVVCVVWCECVCVCMCWWVLYKRTYPHLSLSLFQNYNFLEVLSISKVSSDLFETHSSTIQNQWKYGGEMAVVEVVLYVSSLDPISH